jgi:hypothetical protein
MAAARRLAALGVDHDQHVGVELALADARGRRQEALAVEAHATVAVGRDDELLIVEVAADPDEGRAQSVFI